MKIVYSSKYEVDIGGHVFPTAKYRLIKERLIKDNIADIKDFIEPQKAGVEEVALVHTVDYIDKLDKGTLSYAEMMRMELPYSKNLVEAAYFCAGGTILAARNSLDEKIGLHLGGGFHHAYSDHGEGFCVFNDLSIAIKVLQKEGLIKKALILDVDLHQGNGTARIFKGDASVFTFSIHQENLYPYPKEKSCLDIGLDIGTNDKEYLEYLDKAGVKIIKEFKPDFAVYLAGADPYRKDQLGNLNLTLPGLAKRDELVLGSLFRSHVPTVVVLGGGYAQDLEDTVNIHANTVKVAYNLIK